MVPGTSNPFPAFESMVWDNISSSLKKACEQGTIADDRDRLQLVYLISDYMI